MHASALVLSMTHDMTSFIFIVSTSKSVTSLLNFITLPPLKSAVWSRRTHPNCKREKFLNYRSINIQFLNSQLQEQSTFMLSERLVIIPADVSLITFSLAFFRVYELLQTLFHCELGCNYYILLHHLIS